MNDMQYHEIDDSSPSKDYAALQRQVEALEEANQSLAKQIDVLLLESVRWRIGRWERCMTSCPYDNWPHVPDEQPQRPQMSGVFIG